MYTKLFRAALSGRKAVLGPKPGIRKIFHPPALTDGTREDVLNHLHFLEKLVKSLPGVERLPVKAELLAFEEKLIVHTEKTWSIELEQINFLYKAGEYIKAIQECESVIRSQTDENELINPELSKVHMYLGKVLREGTQQDRDNAEKHLQKSIDLDPNNQEAKDEFYSLLLERGKVGNAKFTYE